MKTETVNVIEVLDGRIRQLIAFTGKEAEAEAAEMFKRLVLEHNDPDHIPAQNILGFDDDTFFQWIAEGEYDDENGYQVVIYYSALVNPNEGEPDTLQTSDLTSTPESA